MPLADLVALKAALVASGARVRLLVRPRNVKPALDALAADGFTHFAFVAAGAATPEALDLRPLA
ncbi:hypothetical protein GCM10025881_29650 [Pseudolysinimonas kribbensis]|uniref:DUF2249 domain-containing protein n=1 Tax=Pseudolysinimonas kribbensis TaxID=433641 RepID=A0ABQ6KCC2_9MICO|nr:hypothetical protein GCM10025881_29650 [Pseudolysinimonas kribbensis]